MPAAAPMMAPMTEPRERSPLLRMRPRTAPPAAAPPIVAASLPVSLRPCWTNEASIGTVLPRGEHQVGELEGELRLAAHLAQRHRLGHLAQDLRAGRGWPRAVLTQVAG